MRKKPQTKTKDKEGESLWQISMSLSILQKNCMAIKAISEKEGVDVDIASRMYAQQQGWTGWEKEMDEWNDIQRSYMKSKTKTLADLFK